MAFPSSTSSACGAGQGGDPPGQSDAAHTPHGETGIDGRELGLEVTILGYACATVDHELERLALDYAALVAGIRVAAVPAGPLG